MGEYKFYKTSIHAVEALQGRLRESDKQEILAASGFDPNKALMDSFMGSSLCWTVTKGGQVIAIFGAAGVSALSSVGMPWMLGSNELNRAGVEIVKVSMYYVKRMKDRFPILVNFIDARQKKSVRWLKWLGFTVEQPQPYGVLGMPFHRFTM